MRTRAVWAIARASLLEAVRRKDIWVVAILGALIVAASGLLGLFGIDGLQVFAKDLSATVLGLFSTILAIMNTVRLIPEELKNRTLYPMLARPISRLDFLLGKLLGAVIATWVGFLFLAGLTAMALAMFHVQFEPIMLQYLAAKLLGLALLCSLALCLSCHMTPSAAATLCFVIAVGVGPISRALVMSFPDMNPVGQAFARLLTALLPQFGLYDLGSRAANIGWSPVPLWAMLSLAGYAVVYGAFLISMGWLRFRRKAI